MSEFIEIPSSGKDSAPAWPQRFRPASFCAGVFCTGFGLVALFWTVDDWRADDLGATAWRFL